MTTPSWVKDAIFYQIFPDRFFNGKKENDPPNLRAWGSAPTSTGFMGGDIEGIIQKLDYLKDLGVNAIYLNPIFLSPSTHRYNTVDYLRIDPKLGDEKDFDRLISKVHNLHMHLILDGVFNHCGRGFYAFSDVLENQSESAYKDWFSISHFPIDAYSAGESRDYLGWWKHKSLPKLNTYNPNVRKYIFDVARYWVERGVDGWRLDVPNEIDDDSFWAEFRNVVRSANPEAYLVGEIWTVDPRWVNDNHFDGLMNYPFREAIINLLNNKYSVSQWVEKLEGVLRAYPKENLDSMYNLLGSHDTERILTLLGSIDKIKSAILLLFSLPGCPAIYYGDEIGLDGGKDPDCRKAFNWNESEWNKDLYSTYKLAIQLRKKYSGLRSDVIKFHPMAAHPHMNAFFRGTGRDTLMIVANSAHESVKTKTDLQNTEFRKSHAVKELISGKEISVTNGHVDVQIPPLTVQLFRGI